MPEHIIDLSGVEIEEGDILYVPDDEKETVHMFRVEKVTHRDEANRVIRVRTIKSGNLAVNSYLDLVINAAVPTFGRIVKHGDVKKQDFTPIEADNFLINELRIYLDGMPKLQSPVKNVVDFLMYHKVLEHANYEDAKKHVLKVIRTRKDLFTSKGGWIKSNGVPYDVPSTAFLPGMISASRKVKLSKVYMAVRLLLESGLFGEIELENE
jgi:hypothetical protein